VVGTVAAHRLLCGESADGTAIEHKRHAMNIVDSQVHIWSADTPDRPWPPGRAHEAQKPYPISKEALLFQMDLAGVRRIVLVPPSWEGTAMTSPWTPHAYTPTALP